MNTNDKKINHYRITLNILFDNEFKANTPTFNLIIQLLDVTFEDVIDNIIYEIKKEMNLKTIQDKKLEFIFDTEIYDSDKIYSFFILVDMDKNNKISIGDYISMDRYTFELHDGISSLSIKVNRVNS